MINPARTKIRFKEQLSLLYLLRVLCQEIYIYFFSNLDVIKLLIILKIPS